MNASYELPELSTRRLSLKRLPIMIGGRFAVEGQPTDSVQQAAVVSSLEMTADYPDVETTFTRWYSNSHS